LNPPDQALPRVLVAGASGYVGRHVCRVLRERGCRVRALVRGPFRIDPSTGCEQFFVADARRPETLRGVARDVDLVFSCMGVTSQRDAGSFLDVDFRGNAALLEEAKRSGVAKFVYVSMIDPAPHRHLEIVDAHERFVELLRATAGLARLIVRPGAYFRDFEELYKLARLGVVPLIGDGSARVTPIAGADVARLSIDACTTAVEELPIGGPETFSYREIGELAFEVARRKPRFLQLPPRLPRVLSRAVAPFLRRDAVLLEFFGELAMRDKIAPPLGSATLREYFQSLARTSASEGSDEARGDMRVRC
jgi:uncharacterized protein YbjT (DUF2867 family)